MEATCPAVYVVGPFLWTGEVASRQKSHCSNSTFRMFELIFGIVTVVPIAKSMLDF